MKLLTCPTMFFESSAIADPEHHHSAAEILQGLISEHGTKCRWNIAIAGPLLCWLAEKRAKSLMANLVALHRDGQCEILLSPAFHPSPALGSEAISRHLDYAREIWQSLGVEGELNLFLPDSATYPGKYRAGIDAAIGRHPRATLLEGSKGIGEVFDIVAFSAKFRCGQTSAQDLDLSEEKLRQLLAKTTTQSDGSFALFLPVFRPLRRLGRGVDERTVIAKIRDIARHFSGSAGASVTARSLGSVSASERSLDSFSAPKPFDSPNTTPAAFRRLFPLQVRLSDASQLKKNPAPAELARLMEAASALLRAENEEFFTPTFLARPDLRAEFFRLMVSADVEIDYLLNPKVDPTVGWVRLAKHEGAAGGAEEFTIDTQLAKFSLHPASSGSLTAFEFKPSKWNIFSTVDPATLLPLGSFIDSVISISEAEQRVGEVPRLFGAEFPSRKARPTVHSRDLLTLRIEGPLSDRFMDATAVKDFSFKAGLGAHLANSTTGVNLEYWIEAERPFAPEEFHVIEFNLSFPSLHAECVLVKPLLCVGGVASEQFHLTDQRRFPSSAIEGGLFGVRLTDSISGFSLDIRSAKQLGLMHLAPLFSKVSEPKPTDPKNSTPLCQGISVRFALSASRLIGDAKSNTLFLSVA